MNRPLRKSKPLYHSDILPDFANKRNVASIDKRGIKNIKTEFIGECLGFCHSSIAIINFVKTSTKCILPVYFIAIMTIYANLDIDKMLSPAFAILATILSAPLIVSLASIAKMDFKIECANSFRGQLYQIIDGQKVSPSNTNLLDAITFEVNKEDFDSCFKYLASSNYEKTKGAIFGAFSSAIVLSNLIYMTSVCIIAILRFLP